MKDGKRSRRRLVMADGLLDPALVGRKFGCLTIATRTIQQAGAALDVSVDCSQCGSRTWARLHKIERRVPRGCKQCVRHFGDHCPEWIYRRVQHQWRRCNDPKEINYDRYGGRGIRFLFASVYEGTCWIVQNLGLPSDRSMELDRINNDGHYTQGNLRWVTPSQNSSNRNSYTRPNSRWRKFQSEFPDVQYDHMYLDTLFRKGMTGQQIADRWRLKFGTSSTAVPATDTPQPE